MAERKRGPARGARRGTLLDSLPRTPVPPRAPVSGGRSGSYPRDPHASDSVETPGRLTLPSMPRAQAARPPKTPPKAQPKTQRQGAPRRPASQPQRQTWDHWGDTGAYDSVSDDEIVYAQAEVAPDAPYDVAYRSYDGDYIESGDEDAYGERYDERYDDWAPRARGRSLARPLTPALPQYNDPDDVLAPLLYAPLPQERALELAAFRPMRGPHRVRLDTRALAQTARNPWTITRLVLAVAAMLLALAHAPGSMGELSQPLMTAQAKAGMLSGGSTTSMVRPETQLMRPDLYDNYAQFQQWGGAACSAAALSEVLTAYGVRGATIGHEIDELGSYISPNGGLLNRHGFVTVAAKHNLRADESMSLTYNQLLYLTQQLGMPVIVNVHISYGYYHFFDGGHFLVVVGGDAQGLQIVDSSEYYIHYLPKDVFYQMFTGYTAAIVPGDYHYTLPNN